MDKRYLKNNHDKDIESVVVELILDINPSELQGDVSEVDREQGRCHYM
jgi:hypothetical protein